MKTNSNIETKTAIESKVDLNFISDYKRRLCQTYLLEGMNDFYKEDFPEAFKHLKRAIKVSEETGDLFSTIYSHYNLGQLHGFNCNLKDALEHFQCVTNIIKKSNSKWGMAINKINQSFFVNFFEGRIDLEFQNSKEGLDLAEQSGDILSKAVGLTCHGVSCYNKRFLADSEKYFLEGIYLGEQINLIASNSIARSFLGEIYYELADYKKSKNYFMNAVSDLKKHRLLHSWMYLNETAIVRSMVMNKEKNMNLEPLYIYISKNKIKIYEGWIRRLLGEILLNMDENYLPESAVWIKQAIDADHNNGMMFHLAKDYVLYADLFKRKDDIPKANKYMTKAIKLFKDCGADGWVEKYEKEVEIM